MSELAKGIIAHFGDCLSVLQTIPECSIDSCVTDPPYHIGFMGKQWDGGDIAFRPELWVQVYRVLKPGAHLLAFGGTRTYHRMACAIEDAGFEIRDCIQWLYGSGFPKSHDVSKGIDRAFGAKREVIGRGSSWNRPDSENGHTARMNVSPGEYDLTAPATDAARQWQGWGTALKPACELIVLARKPLSEKTVAANVLRWGTGAINVDGCRVGIDGGTAKPIGHSKEPSRGVLGDGLNSVGAFEIVEIDKGRWPANVIHDGSAEVVAGFPEPHGAGRIAYSDRRATENICMTGANTERYSFNSHGDEGSAARFFYTAKADRDDRIGSRHPTVKPVDLMQYLVRLVTPKGGAVLDPFAGTGTTGEAAIYEGMQAVLIEREEEYLKDMQRRMRLAFCGPDERAWQSAKARNGDKPLDAGPLFGGSE